MGYASAQTCIGLHTPPQEQRVCELRHSKLVWITPIVDPVVAEGHTKHYFCREPHHRLQVTTPSTLHSHSGKREQNGAFYTMPLSGSLLCCGCQDYFTYVLMTSGCAWEASGEAMCGLILPTTREGVSTYSCGLENLNVLPNVITLSRLE